MERGKKLKVSVILLVLLAMIPQVAYATQGLFDLGVYGSELAGWILSECHRASKTTVYKIDPTATLYTTNIQNGFNCWGTYITDSTSSSATSIVKVAPTSPQPNTIAETASYYNGFTGHITKWTMTIYQNNFATLNANQRTNVIGHEVGHAFGLDDLGQRMNPNSIMKGLLDSIVVTTPAPKDKKGMEVVTHVHITHTFSGSYCTYCYGSEP